MKKRILGVILAALMIISMLPAAGVSAAEEGEESSATDYPVSIDGMTLAFDIENAIKEKLNDAKAGDTVTVTGNTTTDFSVILYIPEGVTVVWKAKLFTGHYFSRQNIPRPTDKKVYTNLLSITGAGTLEVADGGELIIEGKDSGAIAINIDNRFETKDKGTITVKVTGGKVSAKGAVGHDVSTIGSIGSFVDVEVSGNGRVEAEASGDGSEPGAAGSGSKGSAYAIDLEDTVGNIKVSGNANIQARAHGAGYAVGPNIATAQVLEDPAPGSTAPISKGSIIVEGGTIDVASQNGTPMCIFNAEGIIDVSGGTLKSTSGGDSTEGIRHGGSIPDNRTTAGVITFSGGTLTVTNNKDSNSEAFGISSYKAGDKVIISGGTIEVTRTGINGGSHPVFLSKKGDVEVTGGSIIGKAPGDTVTLSTGIEIYDGSITVTGGSVNVSSGHFHPRAIYIRNNGTALLKAGTTTGTPNNNLYTVDPETGKGIIVEVSDLKVSRFLRGTSDALTVKASNGIANAGARWDNTTLSADVPYIEWTGTGASYPKVQWGEYMDDADAGPIREFVTRLYELVLNRDPVGDTGVDEWVGRLQSNQISGIDAAARFFLTEEFEKRNMSNEDFVDLMYEVMLGRSFDSEENRNYWINKLDQEAPRAVLVLGFATSEEFKGICEKAGIRNVPGGSAEALTRGFVARLYYMCLSREPEPEGLDSHTESLLSNAKPGWFVASDFIMGQELNDAGISDEAFVQICYAAILGRDCTEEEVEIWAGRINEKGGSRYTVFKGFTESEEFEKLCAEYGITP